MNKIRSFAFAAALFGGLCTMQATTVIPPTFDELVSRAEIIFQGAVTNVQSQWAGEGAQRHIVTYVTFKVDDALKGAPGASYTMRMLGGTVDGQTMEVSDAPRFAVGDRDILFVEHNGQQFIPLVGIMHGRFHIENDSTGREIVTTNSHQPLADVSRLGKEDAVSSTANAATSAALTPEQFKATIKSTMQSDSAAQARQK